MKVGVFHPFLGIPLIDDLMESVIRGFENYEPDSFIIRNNQYHECDVAIRFGMHSLKFPHTTTYRDIIDRAHTGRTGVIELGWIGDREKYFQFGFGGVSGRAKFYVQPELSIRKISEPDYYLAEQRENTSDDYILLCGQVPWDTSVQHIDYEAWVHRTAYDLRQITSLPIVFRPHPKHPRAVHTNALVSLLGVRISDPAKRTLYEDLDQARCVVVYNSNAAVEALMHGTPAITMDHGSMVYSITHHDLRMVDDPLFPDREVLEDKLDFIISCQWTAEDWALNTPWKSTKEQLNG